MDGESENARHARVEALWRSMHSGPVVPLDLDGLREGLRKIRHPLADADGLLRDIMNALDANHDGKIEFDEFCRFVEHAERELWQLFRRIDRDRNGRLDKAELGRAFRQAGVAIDERRLTAFFDRIDANRDGEISFEEWRDFLVFLPAHGPTLEQMVAYLDATLLVSPEGDVSVGREGYQGLGFFLAGGVAGAVSRTATAPLDRLKVYLIAQTGGAQAEAVRALKRGSPVQLARSALRPLVDATRELWRLGGVRSLWAGNGLNVLKVMPESGIKFGSYEAAKRIAARLEGHDDPKNLGGLAQFFAAGLGGSISQLASYPVDTLKFRMQCETVEGGPQGNRLILETAQKMWRTGGLRAYYRGLGPGLVGMFPFVGIDLTLYEWLRRAAMARAARRRRCGATDAEAAPGSAATGGIGAVSSSVGATAVYPLNLIRTRLQSQGTAIHPPTYAGWRDCLARTVRAEGWRGLYKGLTPNLLKVVPSMSISYMTYEASKKMLGLH